MTVSPETEVEIRRLFFAEHWPAGTISNQLGVHDDVVRRVTGLLSPRRVVPAQRRVVSGFEPFIDEVLKQFPLLRATRVYDMARARGYTGSLRSLREYVASVRPAPRREAFLRLSPLIGEQAQIDWAHVGSVDVDGGRRELWLFVIVLSWSRGMWGEFVLDLGAQTLARSLCRSTAWFGGTTRQWLFDNPKSVVVERRGDAIRFHSTLLDVASHHSVQPRLCVPRKANQKGRVERAIRYVRDRFLGGRSLHSVDDGNQQFLAFIEEVAHERPHPTITGRTVRDCLEEERGRLLAPPKTAFNTDVVMPVAVDKTAFVRFDTNSYSVPSEHVLRCLTLVADERTVRILDGATEVARHARNHGRKRVIEDLAHRRALLDEKRAARDARGRDRLQVVAPRIHDLYLRWVDRGRNLGSVTAHLMSMLDRYGDDIFRAAVDDVVDRDLHDPAAVGAVCERLRKKTLSPIAIEPRFAAHVDDRDVIPHDLESYDARRRR